jgi:hypothetical protein
MPLMSNKKNGLWSFFFLQMLSPQATFFFFFCVVVLISKWHHFFAIVCGGDLMAQYWQFLCKVFILEFCHGIILGLEILARVFPALFLELFVKIARRQSRIQERLAKPTCDCCHNHPLNQLYYAPGGFVFQECDNAYFIQGMMLNLLDE